MNAIEQTQKRLAHEQAFTLVELLLVLVILAILLALAVPSYLGVRRRAQERATRHDLHAAVLAAESYWAVNRTYVGLTAANLRSTYDKGLAAGIATTAADQKLTAFCLKETSGSGTVWYLKGPGGQSTSTNRPAVPEPALLLG